MPDLNVLENPWIDDATMEWHNHTIILRTVEVEAESCPLGDHKGGDDPTTRTCDGCCTEIETHPLGNRKGGEAENDPAARMHEGCFAEEKGLDVPKIEHDAYKKYLLVPRFKGEEENTSETMDLLVESPVLQVIPYMKKASAELRKVKPGGVGLEISKSVVIFVKGIVF